MDTIPVAASLERRIGSVLVEKYKLVRLLGSGGMGAVYEALNTWTKRKVAIKVMHDSAVENADAVERFLREARAATHIGHPNIVDVLDMGRDAATGTLFIVQEYLEGTDLGHVLSTHGTLAPARALEVLLPIVDALALAHEKGIVHRDLKPENIFLAVMSDGSVRPTLIDFGVSKFQPEGAAELALTRTGVMVGTPFYMSPEQARGSKVIDALIDVWALGVVFYEVLSGRRPFEADNYNALMVEILTAPIPPLETAAPRVPASLAAIVSHALARDRDTRFRTMRAFHQALVALPPIADETAPVDGRARGERGGTLSLAQTVVDARSSPRVPRTTGSARNGLPRVAAKSRWRSALIAAVAIAATLGGAFAAAQQFAFAARPHVSAPPAMATRVVRAPTPAARVTAPPPAPAALVAPTVLVAPVAIVGAVPVASAVVLPAEPRPNGVVRHPVHSTAPRPTSSAPAAAPASPRTAPAPIENLFGQ